MPSRSIEVGAVQLRHQVLDANEVIEPRRRLSLHPPRLVLNLSGSSVPDWICPTGPFDSHATFLQHRSDVLLFGPNHLVDADGAWSCEGIAFPEQYLDFYRADFYDHIYQGSKPVLQKTTRDEFVLHILPEVLSDAISVVDPVFLATPLEPDNWARWLSTVVPKLSYYRNSGLDRSCRLLCRCDKPWQRRLLAFMGIDPEGVIEHDPGRTYLCTAVRTTSYSAADFAPTMLERDLYGQIATRCMRVGEPVFDRVFVSRLEQSRRSPHYRALLNEDELIAELSKIGFVSVEPDRLPFEEQVRIFANAKVIVGLGGAGMFNTVFCRPGTKVIDIESGTSFVSDHTRLFAAMDLDYSIIFGRQDQGDSTPIHKRWTVDVAKVCSTVNSLLL